MRRTDSQSGGDPNGRLSVDQRNSRRRRADELLNAGMKQADIARQLGVSRATVSRWARERIKHGHVPKLSGVGRPSRLSAAQVAQVREAMAEGPSAHGIATSRWSGPLIQALILKMTGEDLDPDHARRLFVDLAVDRWQEGSSGPRRRKWRRRRS